MESEVDPGDPFCEHNVSFTSETHFWFEYQGGELFELAGDDDLWVFVNGKLALDLGGLHVSQINKPKSVCASTCGDGAVASNELCDDGPGGNDGQYGNCGVDCRSRGPHCEWYTADGPGRGL